VVEVDEMGRPGLLLGAAVLVGLEGLTLAGFGVLELANLHSTRVALAVTTALFFLALAAGLLACARGLARVQAWSRGPVVAVQLITLLLSFSFWGGETTPVAVVLALVSVVTLICVLHPASTRALAADEG
jgi:peptidoglycan/LPS O-acetylase OafA/YrhL